MQLSINKGSAIKIVLNQHVISLKKELYKDVTKQICLETMQQPTGKG